jgi:hypothetical protein
MQGAMLQAHAQRVLAALTFGHVDAAPQGEAGDGGDGVHARPQQRQRSGPPSACVLRSCVCARRAVRLAGSGRPIARAARAAWSVCARGAGAVRRLADARGARTRAAHLTTPYGVRSL